MTKYECLRKPKISKMRTSSMDFRASLGIRASTLSLAALPPSSFSTPPTVEAPYVSPIRSLHARAERTGCAVQQSGPLLAARIAAVGPRDVAHRGYPACRQPVEPDNGTRGAA